MQNKPIPRRRSCNVMKIPHSKQTTSSVLAVSMLIAKENEDIDKMVFNNLPELNKILDVMKLTGEEREDAKRLLTTEIGEIDTFIINEETYPIAFDIIQSIFFLTMDGFYDPKMQRDILLVVPTYTTPKKYLATLIVRYFDTNDNNCRNRVLAVIAFWAKLSPQLFDEDMILSLTTFSQLLNTIDANSDAMECKLFSRSIEFLKTNQNSNKEEKKISNVFCGPQLFFATLAKHNPAYIADQITLQHSRAFRAISQEDFIQIIFQNENPESLVNYTKIYDALSIFVSFSIIMNPKIEERANIYKLWVEIAIQLRNNNNYFGLFSVVYGLQHRSVRRMTKTMELVKHKIKNISKDFADLEDLISMNSNFKNYREIISISQSPSIPFLACFQKDWVYFRESYPLRKDGLMCMTRTRKGVELLDKILYMRSDDYNITPDEDVLNMISGIDLDIDTIKLMQISNLMEAD